MILAYLFLSGKSIPYWFFCLSLQNPSLPVDVASTLQYNIVTTLHYKIPKGKEGGRLIPSQMLKGTLEGCIMAIISRQPTYGYEIAEQLKNYGFGQIAEGTIYPLLLRLEKNGLANAEYRASEVGPKRKYYALTAKGREELAAFLASYRELTDAVNHLLKDMGGGSP